jgi:hypothetical protein
VHRSVWRTLGAPEASTAGARATHRPCLSSIDGITRAVGGGVDGLLARLQERLDDEGPTCRTRAMRSI